MRAKVLLRCFTVGIVFGLSQSASNIIAQTSPTSNTPDYRNPATLFAIGKYGTCTEGLPILGRGIVELIRYENLDQMIKSSELIVVGQAKTELGSETKLRSMKAKTQYDRFNLPPNQSLVVVDQYGGSSAEWTLTSFAVQKVLKGKLPTSTLQILEPGIVISGKTIAKHIRVIDSDEYTPLREGKTYLLFLRKTLPTPTSFFNPNTTYTTALHQGKYNLDGKDCPEGILAKSNVQHSKLLSEVRAKYAKLFSQ